MYKSMSRGKYLVNLVNTKDSQCSDKVIVLPNFGENGNVTETKREVTNENVADKSSDSDEDKSENDPFDSSSVDDPNWMPSEAEEEIADTGEDISEVDRHETEDKGEREDGEKDKSCSRKRRRNVEEWARNKKKYKVNTGKTYKTKANKVIPARILKENCAQKCRYKCPDKLNNEARLKLLEHYWKIGDIVKQREYVARHISEVNPKYRQTTTNKNGNTRSLNMAYHLTKSDNTRIRVCKTFFKNTLCITDRMIRTTISKIQTGFMIEDFRGKHGKQKKLDPNITARIRKHIESFPRIESHYLRNQTTREFIEGSLNIATMYRLYVEDSKENNFPYAKITSYERIFNYEYNIGFFKPKKDMCAFCESYVNANDQEKAALEDKKKAHDTEKALSRQSKESDKQLAKEGFVKAACFDLEAVLPTPCGEISDFYYKSKLSTFNLSFADLGTGNGHCYMWNENFGRRGANEVATCILDYLTTVCEGNGDIIFYSDNCTGQNKNKYLVALYSYAVQKYNINCITHKYLIVGHTQNEVDAIHSMVEKGKKRTLKSGPISVTEQWIQLVRTAKKSGKPYEVKEMSTDDFIDVKELQQRSGLTNFGTGIWKEIKVLRISKDAPTTLQYKTSFEDENFKTVEMKKKITRGTQAAKDSLSAPKKAYTTPPGITKKKKDGLIELCEKNLIKKAYHSFYLNLSVCGDAE